MSGIGEVAGTRMFRREMRSHARRLLGTSSEAVTSPERLVRAAGYVDQMLWLATGQRLRLAVIDCRSGAEITQKDAVAIVNGEAA